MRNKASAAEQGADKAVDREREIWIELGLGSQTSLLVTDRRCKAMLAR